MSKGFLGIAEGLGLVENETPVVPKGAPVVPPSSLATPSAFPPPPPSFGTSYQPGSVMLSQEDQTNLKAIEQQVYATPSTYVLFRDFRAAMGNPTDANQTLKLLSAANPGVTKAKILADIDTHLGIIATQADNFSKQLQQARQQRIEQPTQQMNDLMEQNRRATMEINERSARIEQMRQAVQDATHAITDGEQRFKLVTDTLNQPLLQAKQVLS